MSGVHQSWDKRILNDRGTLENPWGINHQFARFLVAELVRTGVRQFIVSTGSRSTPLALAVAEREDIEVITHPDERAAAFVALGYGRATGRPAALVCTSGTAVANYYPALIEACIACVPMVVVTADRPIRVRDARTDQVIDQTRVFGDYVRWSFDFPEPYPDFAVEHILGAIDQAVYRATSAPSGPVHLNCCFSKPLVSEPSEKPLYRITERLKKWEREEAPFTTYVGDSSASQDLSPLIDCLAGKKRGVIICGGLDASRPREPIFSLATTLGWPIVADITSSLRFGPKKGAFVAAHADLYLASQEIREKFRPDCILHFGGEPVNNGVLSYFEQSSCDYILVNDHPFRQDPRQTVSLRVNQRPDRLASQLASILKAQPSELYELFSQAEQVVENVLEGLDREALFSEWEMVAEIIDALPVENGLFLGNSLPVREFDRFAPCSDKKLFASCNRGVSGIDGNVSTAFGMTLGFQRPVTVCTGDVAMLHDLNGLIALKKSPVPLTIVIPNNDGGGVFPFLPTVTKSQYFEDFFVAPHGLQFEHAAKMFDIPYTRVSAREPFREAYRTALQSGVPSLIEVTVDRWQNHQEQKDLYEQVRKALRV